MSSEARGGALTPKLRFPEFRETGAWPTKPLSALAKRQSKRNSDHNITRVLTNSAEHGVVDQRDYFEKDIAIQGNLDTYFIAKRGDYVYNPRISNAAPVGPIGKNKVGDGVMSPLYTVFRFSAADDSFYEHYFRSTGWHSYLRRASNSGARHDRMAITNDDFMQMLLPAPHAAEQQKIADCLSSLDEVIAAEGDRLAALRLHKKGLMQALFPAPGKTTSRLRFPEFEGAGEWEERPLEAICDLRAGRFVAASDIAGNPANGLFPCYGGNGLRGYTVSWTHSGRFPLIGRQGALCGNVQFATGHFHATEHALVATPKPGTSADWLYHALVSLNLNQFATGQAQPGLSVDILDKTPCVAPTMQIEQQRIADCLTSIDELVIALGDAIDSLKRQKAALMQQLFPAPGASA